MNYNCTLCRDQGFVMSGLSGKPSRCPCVGSDPLYLVQMTLGAQVGFHCMICDPKEQANGREGLALGTFLLISRIAQMPDESFAHWDAVGRATNMAPGQRAICFACISGVVTFSNGQGRRTLMLRPPHTFMKPKRRLITE